MLERTEYMPLEYYKKQKWSGSYQGMRFLFQKVEETHTELVDGEEKEEKEVFLEAVVWKEPYSYEATPEEEKTRKRFPLSEEGREAAIEWLEETYDSHPDEWKRAMKWNWER